MLQAGIWNGDLETLNSFYKECGYRGASQEDVIVTVQDDERLIAAVRLCNEAGVMVLRGMQVAKEKQGSGIGKLLLEKVDQIIGQKECWGIPYAHLEKFYGRIGFHFVDDENIAPSHLLERVTEYRNRKDGKIYRLMRRK